MQVSSIYQFNLNKNTNTNNSKNVSAQTVNLKQISRDKV